MTLTTNCWLFLVFVLSFTLNIPSSFGQKKEKFQVYKLENKIGTEEVSTLNAKNGSSIQINIRTQDRGAKLMLNATFSNDHSGFKYTSHGHTSRFIQESIDTLIAVDAGYPLSQNGSIKMREMLIAFWHQSGSPKSLRSALDGSEISIQELKQADGTPRFQEFRGYLINHGLDEIFWTDAKGEGVFLTTIDSEGDKREVINEKFLQHLGALNHQSGRYLLNAFKDKSSITGKPNDLIVITGGNIIDVSQGKLQENMMVIIIGGKIDYIGPVDHLRIPVGAQLIDAKNKFLIPGLWDMHAHVFHPDYLQRALRSGVTSVRDMGNEFDWITQMKEMLDQGTLPAPDLYAAGLLDGKSSSTLGTMLAQNAEEIKKNVQRYHEAGFSQIKIYNSVTKSNFNTIVEEAKRYQMQVVGHLPTGYTLSYFLNNGMNSLSHIHYFRNNLKWTSADLVTANKPLLDSMRAKNTYLDPTLNIYRLTKDKNLGTYYKFVKMFADYGVPIVAGTDNEGTISEEIQSYVKLGLTPLNAIKAATIVPATLMGASKMSGSIEKGKNADILILEQNPLSDISTLDKIQTIVKGKFVIHN